MDFSSFFISKPQPTVDIAKAFGPLYYVLFSLNGEITSHKIPCFEEKYFPRSKKYDFLFVFFFFGGNE